jgi:CBS domain containing-hemolysin-like protein
LFTKKQENWFFLVYSLHLTRFIIKKKFNFIQLFWEFIKMLDQFLHAFVNELAKQAGKQVAESVIYNMTNYSHRQAIIREQRQALIREASEALMRELRDSGKYTTVQGIFDTSENN